jgi:hypothetical protein
VWQIMSVTVFVQGMSHRDHFVHVQTLEHPACVWDVAFLPNGDLVTACADFAARVWTPSPERVASAETIQVWPAVVISAAVHLGSGAELIVHSSCLTGS